MKYLPDLLIAFLLAGCVMAPASEYPPDRAIGHWIGHPIEDVIAAWGKPTREEPNEEGHLYVWMASQYDKRYYPVNLQEKKIFPYLEGRDEISCKGVLEVDDEGRVVRAAWEGDECDMTN